MVVGKKTPVTIESEMRSSYLDYAMSVIVSRALPDVRDGLKPDQRRIIRTARDNTRRRRQARAQAAARAVARDQKRVRSGRERRGQRKCGPGEECSGRDHAKVALNSSSTLFI